MELIKVIRLTQNPMGAVRKTQSDRWRKRPCVEAEHRYRDEIREQMSASEMPHPYLLVFVRAMPNSWSATKKQRSLGQLCEVRPDKDNLEKCWSDALFEEDGFIADGRVIKLWGLSPEIRVFKIEALDYPKLLEAA